MYAIAVKVSHLYKVKWKLLVRLMVVAYFLAILKWGQFSSNGVPRFLASLHSNRCLRNLTVSSYSGNGQRNWYSDKDWIGSSCVVWDFTYTTIVFKSFQSSGQLMTNNPSGVEQRLGHEVLPSRQQEILCIQHRSCSHADQRMYWWYSLVTWPGQRWSLPSIYKDLCGNS